MSTVTSHSALRLYALAHEKAVKNVGKAVFDFQNNTVKHALVAVEIIHIVNAQDDDVRDIRDLLFDMSLLNGEQYNVG